MIPLLEFGYTPSPDHSIDDLAILHRNCCEANKAMEDLATGRLSLDDAIALSESFGADADQTLEDLHSNLQFLGFI